MSKIRAIFFDIDDTLYSTSEFAEEARKNSVNAMVKMGVRVDPGDLLSELDEVVMEFSSNYENHFDKLLLRIPRELYSGINSALIVAAGITAYHDTKFRHLRPYEDVYEVLQKLSHTSLIRGVITEGIEMKQAEKLVRMRLVSFFSLGAVFISDQMGVSKPNVKLFQQSCSFLGLNPSESMYVGNNPVLDIDPANSIGMYTVQVVRGNKSNIAKGETEPDWKINNFWDLLDLLHNELVVEV